MLDKDDEQIIKDCKEAGAIFVTWDRIVREAAGGMTPYEVLEKATNEKDAPPEAIAEVSRLKALTPEELTALSDEGNKTYDVFSETIKVNEYTAKLIRLLRVDMELSWRAIARRYSETWKAPWGSNQIAGMVLCRKAAEALGENYMEPPWN